MNMLPHFFRKEEEEEKNTVSIVSEIVNCILF